MYNCIYLCSTTEKEKRELKQMALNFFALEMFGGLAASNSAPSMAAPVVGRAAVNWSRKSIVRSSDLSCRAQKIEEVEEQDYSGTAYVPVYVMLPSGIFDMGSGKLQVDSLGLRQQLKELKATNVDGVKVECWWGIVESQLPQHYDWSEYKYLFDIVRDNKLKLQVVFCFHGCGGNNMHIPLPRWVMEVGKKDPDIFFTDREGRRNYECLTWGIDRQTVLLNRSAFEVYRDFMISFRREFEEFDGLISDLQIGLGPYGELRFPSHIAAPRGQYPHIQEFQCYDKYMMKSLKEAWKQRSDPMWGVKPLANSYKKSLYFLQPMTEFSFYGQFFINWYSRVLVDHADMLLSLPKSTLLSYCTSAKIPGICHLWYERGMDPSIVSILNKYKTSLNSTLTELRTIDRSEDIPKALADEIGLGWQLLHAAWAAGIPVSGENDLPCYDRQGYHEILEIAKPINDPIGRYLSSFTYHRLGHQLMEKHNLREFESFVQSMHGETTS